MKTIFCSIVASLFLFTACDRVNSMNDRAIESARSFLTKDLGDGANKYEEVSWGKVEPRKVNWQKSTRYKNYADTIAMMESHLQLMNDSLKMELTTNGPESPSYNTLRLRRDGYEMYLNTFRTSEAERERLYGEQPETSCYWIYHEYIVNGQVKKAYICFDDTTNFTPTEIIYE